MFTIDVYFHIIELVDNIFLGSGCKTEDNFPEVSVLCDICFSKYHKYYDDGVELVKLVENINLRVYRRQVLDKFRCPAVNDSISQLEVSQDIVSSTMHEETFFNPYVLCPYFILD